MCSYSFAQHYWQPSVFTQSPPYLQKSVPLIIMLNDCLSFSFSCRTLEFCRVLDNKIIQIQYFQKIFHIMSLNFRSTSFSRTADVQLFIDQFAWQLVVYICGNFMSTHINVHPQWVSGADVCDGIKRVEGSIHGSSCCGVHIEWNQTLEHSSSTFKTMGQFWENLYFSNLLIVHYELSAFIFSVLVLTAVFFH